ncbi:MAG: hypothetical protein SF029_24675 [bacterium]|nr:hypothetical protein [bacterium]
MTKDKQFSNTPNWHLALPLFALVVVVVLVGIASAFAPATPFSSIPRTPQVTSFQAAFVPYSTPIPVPTQTMLPSQSRSLQLLQSAPECAASPLTSDEFIAFAASRLPIDNLYPSHLYQTDIFLMEVTTSDVQPQLCRLTNVGSEEMAYDPVISPDGSRVAFVGNLATDLPFYAQSATDLFLINIDGSGLVNLTNAPDRQNQEPDWSPDGQRLAFNALNLDIAPQASGMVVYSSDLYLLDLNNSGADPYAQRLTTWDGWDVAPAWSPDGQRIAFRSDRDLTVPPPTPTANPNLSVMGSIAQEETFNLFIVEVADQPEVNVQQVTRTTNTYDNGPPAWSPDGQRLAFTRGYRPGTLGTPENELYVIDVDGSNETLLTPEEEQALISHPQWSADGFQLMAVRGLISPGGVALSVVPYYGVFGSTGSLLDPAPQRMSLLFVEMTTMTTTSQLLPVIPVQAAGLDWFGEAFPPSE